MKTTTRHGRDHKTRKAAWQGQNWIRPAKRLAIYLRDGLACVWCGAAVEDGTQLTLDHVVAYARGGSHAADNLVTSCHRCNSSRGDRTIPRFAKAVAAYLNHGVDPVAIVARVRRSIRRTIDVPAAVALIALRGSCKRVLDAH